MREASGRIVGTTSNPGKLFAIGAQPARRGSYESDVRDAGTVATWGVIRWRAAPNGGQVELFTRSGNTATPDQTWSAWSKAYTTATGEQIASPNARYLQWRAVLTAGSASPVLTSVTAAYLPRNLRPSISSITVHPPGTVFQRPFSTGDPEIAGFQDNSPDGRPGIAGPEPGQRARHSADGSTRRVFRRSSGRRRTATKTGCTTTCRTGAKVSRRGASLQRALLDPIFVWDTTSVPDGTYFVKVTASDAPVELSRHRARRRARKHQLRHRQHAPARRGAAVRARRQPDQHHLLRARRTVPGSARRVPRSMPAAGGIVHPKDGIPDSRREEFEVVLEESEAGRSVIIRATDAMDNVATAVAEIKK